MTTRGTQTIKYDPENRPVRVKVGGTICRFGYDGDGARRKRLDENGTIHYLGGYERNVGNGFDTTEVVTKYYPVAFGKLSRLIAFRKNGTLYWVGTDHLGSTIRVADSSFTPVDGMRYLPYGADRDAGASLNTDHKFTSQVRDESIGLYWYNARAYDPTLGRFVAPDTVVPKPENPQTLNRYAYGLNNPTKHVDPTGHAAADLQHLVPNWFDTKWEEDFENHNHRTPGAGDYVYRFVTMGLASKYSGRAIMRSVTTAIGAGLSPSGPGLWSKPVDQTGLDQRASHWDEMAPRPEDQDRIDFGPNFQEYRWGKIRIVFNASGLRGGIARTIGELFSGNGDNAVTFSPNLIVFPGPLDVNQPRGMQWLMHELGHVMQAQELGAAYLPKYIAMSVLGHANNPMEQDANHFANSAGIPWPDMVG